MNQTLNQPLESLGLRHTGEQLFVLDQTLLPDEERWLPVRSSTDMAEMIRQLKVRGAPLIGVAAALALAEECRRGVNQKQFLAAADLLRSARPTAVNLMAAVDRMLELTRQEYAPEKLVREAVQIFVDDVELAERMANNGEPVIQDGDGVLTHCNTGGLATAGVGTALGVIRRAHERGKRVHVYVDETRPLLQGGRLTTWELERLRIPYTLICDNMAAALMAKGKVQLAITGSDRIAANGDFANKVGTYGVAVSCHFHKIPFYVAAPFTTVDPHCANGDLIPIEERRPEEVRGVKGSFGSVRWSPMESEVWNPAFDVTPNSLVTGWITDRGLFTRQDIERGVFQPKQSDALQYKLSDALQSKQSDALQSKQS